jgi:hypothetical protein
MPRVGPSLLAVLSLAAGGVLLFGGSLLIPMGIAFIAGGAFLLVSRAQTAFAPAIARARAVAWLPDALCAALLLALTLVMLGKVAAGDRPISFDHTVHYFQAWVFKERFWKDGWFFWTNLWFAGYPMNYTYPTGAYVWIALVHWLTAGTLTFGGAYAVAFWLVFVVHGLSVYLLGRLAFNRIVGLMAAVLYLVDRGANSAGGWFWIVDIGTWPVALSIACSTIATALLARILEGGRRRDVVWCAVLIGLALLTHPLQLVYVPILCATAFVLSTFVVGWARLRTTAWHAAAAVGCGLLIGALWYLPFLAYSDYSRAYGWQWVSLDQIGANVYQGTLFPAGATLTSREVIPSVATGYVPETVDGLAVYVTVLSVLALPILFLSRRLLPMLVSVLMFLLLVGASSSLHDAIGLPQWWAGYQRMEFARFSMLFKPFMCVGAAVGVWALWRGLKDSTLWARLRPPSVWNGYARVVIAVALVLWPTLPGIVVALNRHVFQTTATKSGDRSAADRAAVVQWIRHVRAKDPRFFRVAARGNDDSDHSLIDLGAELEVPMIHLGYTPAAPFRYSLGKSSEFLAVPSDSNDTFRTLNVRYVVSKVPVERPDWRHLQQFGTLTLYEFADWNPNPYVVTEGQGEIELVRFEDEAITFRAAPGAHGKLRLNVSYFPRWSAFKDDQPIAIDVSSAGQGTGFMVVDLSPGVYDFRFTRGLAEWLGLVMAMLGVGGLARFASSGPREPQHEQRERDRAQHAADAVQSGPAV